MNPDPLLSFIKKTAPHIIVTPDAASEISEAFEFRNYTANAFLLKEGTISPYFFLHQGLVKSYTHNPAGDEITTAFYSGERVVFDVASFFQQIHSEENIKAVTDCSAALISFEKLNYLFHTFPEFREFGRAILAKEFASFKKQALRTINSSAEQRYQDLVNEHPEIIKHARMKDIAAYLGITDTSLSRIRKAISTH